MRRAPRYAHIFPRAQALTVRGACVQTICKVLDTHLTPSSGNLRGFVYCSVGIVLDISAGRSPPGSGEGHAGYEVGVSAQTLAIHAYEDGVLSHAIRSLSEPRNDFEFNGAVTFVYALLAFATPTLKVLSPPHLVSSAALFLGTALSALIDRAERSGASQSCATTLRSTVLSCLFMRCPRLPHQL
jgi:hypothetical protein